MRCVINRRMVHVLGLLVILVILTPSLISCRNKDVLPTPDNQRVLPKDDKGLNLSETIWKGTFMTYTGAICEITISFNDAERGKFGLDNIPEEGYTAFVNQFSKRNGDFYYSYTDKMIRLITAQHVELSTDWWIKSKKPGELLLFSNPTANSCQLHLKQVF